MKFSLSFCLKPLVCLIAALVLQAQLQAASYYVDYAGGSDSAAGTSTNAAWKHCPGDRSATGVASSTSLAPGDKVYFKGGVTYRLSFPGIQLNWDGAAGQPITYDGNSAGTWGGTNRANFADSYNSDGSVQMVGGQYGFCAFIGLGASDNYLNFCSLDIGPVGGSTNLPADHGSALAPVWGGGIECQGGVFRNLTISNCYFHGLGYWYNQQPMNAGSIAGNGITCNGFTNLTITNCEFTEMATACELGVSGNCGNLNIGNCSYHDSIVWCIDLARMGTGTTLDNVFIHNNRFYDYSKQFGAGAWQGYGGYGSWPHCDGVFMRGNSSGVTFTDGTNIDVYANLFYETPPGSGGGTASIFMVGGVSANIYNNLFLSPAVANGVITCGDNWTQFLLRIYNNTFYTKGQIQIDLGGLNGGMWPVVTTNVEVDVKNNIFYDNLTPNQDSYIEYFTMTNGSAAANLFFDYNDYSTLNSRPAYLNWSYCGNANFTGTGLAVGTSLKTLFHWELHGITNSPLFALNTNAVYLTNNDYRPLTNSAAYTNGTSLSYLNLPGLNLDFLGNSRTNSRYWGMGAFLPSVPIGSIATNSVTNGNSQAGAPQTPAVTNADLQVTGSVNAITVATNQPVVFALQLANNGPSNVPASLTLVVTNKLPSTFAYVSSSPGGVYNSATGLWTVTGGLASGGSTTLAITAVPGSAGTFTNYSSVAVPNGITDTNLANNSSLTVLTVTNVIAQVVSGSLGSGTGSSGGSNSGGNSQSNPTSQSAPPPPTGVKVVFSGD